MNYELFNIEINYIKNEKIKESTRYMINKLPDYFFEVQAASTGKYHPKYALGKAGLLRHTKAVVRFAYELLENPIIGEKYTNDEKDLMIMALILHDGLKHGKDHSEYSVFEHPVLIANMLMEEKDNLSISEDMCIFVSDCMKTHMGPWTKDYKGNEVLERPKTKYQNFVHMCDYLASRKVFSLSFNDDNDIIID